MAGTQTSEIYLPTPFVIFGAFFKFLRLTNFPWFFELVSAFSFDVASDKKLFISLHFSLSRLRQAHVAEGNVSTRLKTVGYSSCTHPYASFCRLAF